MSNLRIVDAHVVISERQKAGKTGLKTFSLLGFSRLSHNKNMLLSFYRY